MASYPYQHDLSVDKHLDYDEEEQFFESIEEKFEETKGRLLKTRERKTRLLLDKYLEDRRHAMLEKDLYDPDLEVF